MGSGFKSLVGHTECARIGRTFVHSLLRVPFRPLPQVLPAKIRRDLRFAPTGPSQTIHRAELLLEQGFLRFCLPLVEHPCEGRQDLRQGSSTTRVAPQTAAGVFDTHSRRRMEAGQAWAIAWALTGAALCTRGLILQYRSRAGEENDGALDFWVPPAAMGGSRRTGQDRAAHT